MEKIRLTHGRVGFGEPLPFALFDGHGRLMLKLGQIIPSQDLLDRLIERGVFFDEIFEEVEQKVTEKTPVFLRLSELAADFESLIVQDTPDYSRILEISTSIQYLCGLDADAALANVQLQVIGRHSIRQSFRAAVMTEVLLKRLDRPEDVRRYAISGALTMNIGMLDLQDILYSQSAPLTDDQKRIIIMHPQVAIQALQKQGIEHPVWLEVVGHHHEMIDGSGYPKRLLKSDLSTESQVVSLADRYCAMVCGREYREGLLPSVAAKELLGRQSATIEPALTAVFLKELGIYPPGTIVSLANGEIAVVVKRLLKSEFPMVRSLRSAHGVRYSEPPKRITSTPAYTITEALRVDVTKGFDLGLLWPPVQLGDGNNEVVSS